MVGKKSGARGLVAAGSPETCRAGREVLEAGGNAVDAAVAAVGAAFVAEAPLTSPAGGGVMLIGLAEGDDAIACDLFSDSPGRGLGPPDAAALDFGELIIDFGAARQSFHVGRGTAAVPACLAGLLEAHRRHGRLPVRRVFEPAIRLAHGGVVLTPAVANITRILEPILTLTGPIRALFTREGRILGAGDRFANPALGTSLERLIAGGAGSPLTGFLADAILDRFGPPAGRITRDDLEAYRPRFSRPLEIDYRGHRIFTVPPPAAGGTWMEFGLKILEGFPIERWEPDGASRMAAICGTLELAARRRPRRALRPRYPPHRDWGPLRRRLAGFLGSGPARPDPGPDPREPAVGSTTHVSVVDAGGNAVAVTTSNGESCGWVADPTGFVMNNFMGEEDINPGGFFRIPAGHRVPTMMAPCLVRAPTGSWTALGTGGSNRIRSAMLQMLVNLIDHRLHPSEAVRIPRVHLDDSGVFMEALDRPCPAESGLRARFPDLAVFEGYNFFFGGVHVAGTDDRGRFTGSGDPRRGGVTSEDL